MNVKEKIANVFKNVKGHLPNKKEIKEEAETIERELVQKDTFRTRVMRRLSFITPYGKLIEKLYLFIFLALFIVLFFEQGSIISEDKALILVVGAGGLFILRSLRKRIYFPKNFTILLAVFFLISVVSTIFAVNLYNSLLGLSYIFSAILLGILGYDIVYGKYSRRWLMNAFLLALSIFLVYGIIRYALDKTSLVYPLGFPAYVGAMVTLFMPFALSSTLKTRGKRQILFAITAIILILSAFLTFATPIWIIAGIEIIVFVALNALVGRRLMLKRKYFTPFVVIALVSILLSFLLHFSTSGTVPFTQSSFADRNMPVSLHLAILEQDWKSFTQYPIVGSGLNTFRLVSLYHESKAWEITYYAMNDFAEMFASTGIFGGLVFLSVFIYVFFEVFRKKNIFKVFKKQSPETSEISIGLLSVTLLALYYPLFHVPVILMTTFLLMGVLLKALTVDNVKRFYFGNLSIGIINGFAIFFILMTGYFFFTNKQFTDIQNSINQSNATASQQQIEKLVQINPINSSFSSLLATIYLYEGNTDKAIAYTNQAAKYDRLSPYITYTQAENYYYKGDMTKAKQLIDGLIAAAPYADPRFYVLKVQIDQSTSNQTVLKNDLKQIIDRFPIDSEFYLYQPIFENIGFTDTLSQVYLEYGLLTNDKNYQQMAQKISPSSFSIFGQ